MKTKSFYCCILILGTFTHVTFAADSTARTEFETVFGEWKALLGDMRMLRAQAQNSDDSELPEMSTKYEALIRKGESLVPKLRDTAIAVYLESPNEDRQITNWLATIAEDYVALDRFNEALPAIEALIEGKTQDKVVYNNAGIVAFAKHDFEKAKTYFDEAEATGSLSSQGRVMASATRDYLKYWQREKRLRDEADALEGDARLPRVKLETNRGTMIVELFEDEAPETVANFIHLIEEYSFYDGLSFHRVIGGFMAQGGCPEGTGRGGPGYEIYCECVKPTHRKHFTGSLSMAHAGRDTGGSQFFITFVPTPQLNGDHTVFGRVVEGLDVLAKITRRDPDKPADLTIVPDKIIKATVLNKRDRDYKPNKRK